MVVPEKTAYKTHEARNLDSTVKWNDLFILNAIEFPTSEPDIGFGKGHLPENLALRSVGLECSYILLKLGLTRRRKARRASAHRDVTRQAQRIPELPSSVVAGNGGRHAELLSEPAVHQASCEKGPQLDGRGQMAHILGTEEER